MDEDADKDLDSYVLHEQVGYLLRLANQRHTAIFQKHSIENLTPTQFSAILRVSEQGQVSQNQLGRLTGMDVATVKGVVERLKTKHFIELNADPDDKRRIMISLTDAGHKLVPELKRIGAIISEETLAPLTDTQRANLIKILGKLG